MIPAAALALIAGLNIAYLSAHLRARDANRRLTALRANAFVTDERGVRVRYVNASAAVRAKVEAN